VPELPSTRERHRPMKRPTILLLVVALLAVACAGAPPPASPSPIILDGTSWRAILVDGAAPVAGSEPTLAFRGNRVEGTDGCNSFGGDVTFTATGFTVKEVASTLILCEGQVGVVSGAFMTILNGVERVGLADGRLVLTGPSAEVVLAPVG
jgi:heat shock protein HslJ